MVSVISAVSSLGALGLCIWVHSFVRKNNLDVTVSTGTALIDMYFIRCGEIEEALKVFDEMPKRNVFTWAALIDGLAVHGRSREALRMFNLMRDSGLHPDYITFVGVLVACSHGGLLEDGWRAFKSMRVEYGKEPGLEHYGCLLIYIFSCLRPLLSLTVLRHGFDAFALIEFISKMLIVLMLSSCSKLGNPCNIILLITASDKC